MRRKFVANERLGARAELALDRDTEVLEGRRDVVHRKREEGVHRHTKAELATMEEVDVEETDGRGVREDGRKDVVRGSADAQDAETGENDWDAMWLGGTVGGGEGEVGEVGSDDGEDVECVEPETDRGHVEGSEVREAQSVPALVNDLNVCNVQAEGGEAKGFEGVGEIGPVVLEEWKVTLQGEALQGVRKSCTRQSRGKGGDVDRSQLEFDDSTESAMKSASRPLATADLVPLGCLLSVRESLPLLRQVEGSGSDERKSEMRGDGDAFEARELGKSPGNLIDDVVKAGEVDSRDIGKRLGAEELIPETVLLQTRRRNRL